MDYKLTKNIKQNMDYFDEALQLQDSFDVARSGSHYLHHKIATQISQSKNNKLCFQSKNLLFLIYADSDHAPLVFCCLS